MGFFNRKKFRHPFINRDWSKYKYKPRKKNIFQKIGDSIKKGASDFVNDVKQFAKGEYGAYKNYNEAKKNLVKHLLKGNFKGALDDVKTMVLSEEQKIDIFEHFIDKYSFGLGSIALETAVPEIAITKELLHGTDEILNGKPPIDVVQTVVTALVIQYAFKSEANALQVSADALASDAVKKQIMKQPFVAKMKRKIQNKLNEKLRAKGHPGFMWNSM